MKTYSLEKLTEMAAAYFAANPEAEKILAFPDGNFFLEEKKNAAEFHAKQLGAGTKKGPVKPYVIERPAKSTKKTAPKNEGTLKHDWEDVTVKQMKAVLDNKEINHSEAKRKDDLAGLLEAAKIDPKGAEAILAEIADAEAKAQAANEGSGEE